MDTSTAFAVVYAADGSRHKVCWTSDDILAAVDELVAGDIKPVVFHRGGPRQVVNNHVGSSSGTVFQAGVIHGVKF